MVDLPWSIVNQCEFSKVIAFKKGCDGSFTTNDHIHGSFQDNVPTLSLISLVEHCRKHEKRYCIRFCFPGKIDNLYNGFYACTYIAHLLNFDDLQKLNGEANFTAQRQRQHLSLLLHLKAHRIWHSYYAVFLSSERFLIRFLELYNYSSVSCYTPTRLFPDNLLQI